MTPRFQLAQLRGGVRWEHWVGGWRVWRGQNHESESGHAGSEEPLRHPRGGIRWEVEGSMNL